MSYAYAANVHKQRVDIGGRFSLAGETNGYLAGLLRREPWELRGPSTGFKGDPRVGFGGRVRPTSALTRQNPGPAARTREEVFSAGFGGDSPPSSAVAPYVPKGRSGSNASNPGFCSSGTASKAHRRKNSVWDDVASGAGDDEPAVAAFSTHHHAPGKDATFSAQFYQLQADVSHGLTEAEHICAELRENRADRAAARERALRSKYASAGAKHKHKHEHHAVKAKAKAQGIDGGRAAGGNSAGGHGAGAAQPIPNTVDMMYNCARLIPGGKLDRGVVAALEKGRGRGVQGGASSMAGGAGGGLRGAQAHRKHPPHPPKARPKPKAAW
jgi:hypothetical protein